MVNKMVSVKVQVEAVRFKGNGAIFTGLVLDEYGVQTGEEVMVRCPKGILYPREEVFKGEIWSISGFKEIYKGNSQLGAVRASLSRPTGENIIAAIASNPLFERIGEKKARDLWATFGMKLYDLLDANEPNIEALGQVLTPDAVERLLSAWKAEYASDLYRWMDENHIPVTLGRRLQEHYGKHARNQIEKDPYRVLAFGQPWRIVDDMARQLGITKDDPRRQHAAVAEVLYQHFAKGHTAMATELLTDKVAQILCNDDLVEGMELAYSALRHTYTDGAFVKTGERWQATGVFLMEAFISKRICKMIANEDTQQIHIFDSVIKQVIARYEEAHHHLSYQQKKAVFISLKSRFCIITGGAGVGKTSVLRCIYNAIEAANGHILQMALSGRAAKRMEEASGRPARTIAGFLHKVKQEELEKVTHAIIDEASMLDVVSAFHILERLPEHVSLIMVGDPYQLPPIGAGLTFHVLAEADAVPVARLTKVYRQSGESGIPNISNAIRNGAWPYIPEYRGRKTGVFSLQVGRQDVTSQLSEIYRELGGFDDFESVQILSAIKADNPYGVVGINKDFHERCTEGENVVLVKSDGGDLRDSGFRQNDKILVTKNQWEKGLFNGSLGYINEAFKIPVSLDEGRYAVAKVVIDGKDMHLMQDDLDWVIHGYSISVHKAQGSQFSRIIVPVCKSKLLDRTLVYTAITRGIDQVVLLGDLDAARFAVEAPPKAWLRQIGFDTLMRRSVELAQHG
jgi:exodeoxyribonuclease V alpha subunit